jgi:hypothetical protein
MGNKVPSNGGEPRQTLESPPAPAPIVPTPPPQASVCEPEECKAFPIHATKDYLRRYYRLIPAKIQFPAEMFNFIMHYIEEVYNVGDHIDARDKTNKWYFSTVLAVRENEILVHFEGWASKWDEWLPIGSERIAPTFTHSNRPIPTANSNRPFQSSSFVPNEDHIVQIASMGFTVEQATTALRTHGNNLENAINSLLG